MGNTSQTLKAVAELFGKIGWDKRLCDLSEEEVLGVIVVLQSLKDIEHEYLNEYLREVYERYGSKPDEDWGIPF